MDLATVTWTMSASLYRAAELLDDAVVRARWSGRSLGANLTLGETGKSMKAVGLAVTQKVLLKHPDITH